MKKKFIVTVVLEKETMQNPSTLDIRQALERGSGKYVKYEVKATKNE